MLCLCLSFRTCIRGRHKVIKRLQVLGKHLNICEDSLTASVFTHLLHLPSEYFWQILRDACQSNSLPNEAGEPRFIDYWPRWDPRGTDNNTYVEPDLFIRFSHFDLIIEAKFSDEGGQEPEQWKRELTAYTNRYGRDNVPVIFIALGGVWRKYDTQLPFRTGFCPVHMCRWSMVLLECQRLERRLEREKKSHPSSRLSADLRILQDLIVLFTAHKFVPLRWFADFDFRPNVLSSSVESDARSFRDVSLQYQPS